MLFTFGVNPSRKWRRLGVLDKLNTQLALTPCMSNTTSICFDLSIVRVQPWRGPWFDPTVPQTHDLSHTRRACWSLHHQGEHSNYYTIKASMLTITPPRRTCWQLQHQGEHADHYNTKANMPTITTPRRTCWQLQRQGEHADNYTTKAMNLNRILWYPQTFLVIAILFVIFIINLLVL